MERRTLLTRGSALIAVVLAGCTSDDDPNPPTTDGDGGDGSGGGDGGDGGDGGATTTTTTTSDGGDTTTSTTEGGDTTTTTTGGGDTTTTVTDDPTTEDPPSSVEVTVGANGRARFDPESFVVAAGGTVTWTWEGSGHNVRPASQPDGADWSGTAGGDSTTYNSGHTYEHTFEVAGEYEYYCAPHRSLGMTGSFTVVG